MLIKRVATGLAALAIAFAVTTSPVGAQNRTATFGIALGATLPTGDLSDTQETGYHGLVTVGLMPATLPFGLRFDGMFNELAGDGAFPDLRIWAVTGNAVLNFAPGQTIMPYLIGGLGYYSTRFDVNGTTSESDLGVNAGVGARFQLAGFSTFAEGRFHSIFVDNGNARIIPLTFGVMF